RMELGTGLHAFDGLDPALLALDSGHQAREHELTVEQDGASAALAELATVLGAGERKIFAHHFEQGLVAVDEELARLAVDGKPETYFFAQRRIAADVADGDQVRCHSSPRKSCSLKLWTISCSSPCPGRYQRATQLSAPSSANACSLVSPLRTAPSRWPSAISSRTPRS